MSKLSKGPSEPFHGNVNINGPTVVYAENVSISGAPVAVVPADVGPNEKDMKSLGCRNIGPWGGGVLMLNNMIGPAIVQIPVLFQQAGWFIPLIVMLLCMFISGISSTLMCEAMTLLPGNKRMRERMELTTLSEKLFKRKLHLFVVFMFVVSLEALNMAQILVSAQTMDMALVAIKATCALEMYPKFTGTCVYVPGDGIQPFGNAYVISVGFIIILLIAIPLGYMNLEDNIIVQWAAVIIMFCIFGEWVLCFCYVGVNPNRVPFIGTFESFVNVMGTIVFNYAYVTTVPSWVNEKKKGVSVNKTIWYSGLVATAIYLFLGFLGSWTFSFENNQTLLNTINTTTRPPKWVRIMSSIFVYIFPIATQVSSIPVMSIIIRYNLITSGFCHARMANFWAVIFPWIVSAPFYTGAGFSDVINYTGLLINGFLNFTIPIALFIVAKNRYDRRNAALLGPRDDGPGGFLAQRRRTQTLTDGDGLDYEMHAIPLRCQRYCKPLKVAWGINIFITLVVVFCIIATAVYLGIDPSGN